MFSRQVGGETISRYRDGICNCWLGEISMTEMNQRVRKMGKDGSIALLGGILANAKEKIARRV